MRNLEIKVREYINRYKMIENGDRVIVGISGGADSVCLFFVLLKLQREIRFSLAAVHVNHGLRGADADADEQFVKELCENIMFRWKFAELIWNQLLKNGNNLLRRRGVTFAGKHLSG